MLRTGKLGTNVRLRLTLRPVSIRLPYFNPLALSLSNGRRIAGQAHAGTFILRPTLSYFIVLQVYYQRIVAVRAHAHHADGRTR